MVSAKHPEDARDPAGFHKRARRAKARMALIEDCHQVAQPNTRGSSPERAGGRTKSL